MEWQLTKEQENFLNEINNFIKEEPPGDFPIEMSDEWYGEGAWSYEYLRRLGAKGWLSLTWPVEYGGQGKSEMFEYILKHEMAYHRAPIAANMYNGFVARCLIKYGSKRLKDEFLPRMARGEISFCQGYSEPEAGSDLFALKTTAVERDDNYVINGQKVWTGAAHLAHYIFILARTDPDAPRHLGLSSFIVDLKTPGVTVRPLANMLGHSELNEVFFDDVKVSKDYLIGEKNKALKQLLIGFEGDRFWGRCVKAPLCKRLIEELVEFVKEERQGTASLSEVSLIQHRLAELTIETEICDLLFYKIIQMMDRGLPITYEISAAKVFADELGQKVANIGMQILGLYGPLKDDSRWCQLNGDFARLSIHSYGHTLAGGSSEMERNTVATRGLGLPRQ